MKKSRRKFSSTFKAKVVLEALKEQSTMQELASKYEIHSTQIMTWKMDFKEKASAVFDSKSQSDQTDLEKEDLYNKIGHMQVQIDFLKKVLGK